MTSGFVLSSLVGNLFRVFTEITRQHNYPELLII